MEKKSRQAGSIGFYVIMALCVGIVTGLVGHLFNEGVRQLVRVTMLYHPISFQARMLFIPISGGILIGLMNRYVFQKNDGGFGIAWVREEMRQITRYLMQPRSVLLKTLANVLTMSIGWSVGRHGPIVHLGGAIGSWIGYNWRLDKEKTKTLIACGAAGALGGVFREPLFAALFVLEVLLHKDYLRYFTPVTISAVSASAVAFLVSGPGNYIPVFGEFAAHNPSQIAELALLGVVMGLVATVYVRAIRYSRRVFQRIRKPLFRAVLAGGLIAVVGFFLPDIFDLHTGFLERVFDGSFGWKLLLILAVAKIFVTAVTFGGGGVGGVFFPGLFVGSAAGYALGLLVQQHSLGPPTTAASFGLIGMIAMFAGYGNAPLSAAVLAVELSGSNDMIIPALLASLISAVLVEVLNGDSMYGHSNFMEMQSLIASIDREDNGI